MSVIAKLSKPRVKLTAEEISEVISEFGELKLKEKISFLAYIQTKELSLRQFRALYAEDALWLLNAKLDLPVVVQNTYLEKMIKQRVSLYKAVAHCSVVSPKVIAKMLASRNVTPQIVGAMINNVKILKGTKALLAKFPTSVKYADGKVRLTKSVADEVVDHSKTLAKYITVVRTSTKQRLEELKARKAEKVKSKVEVATPKAEKVKAEKAKPKVEVATPKAGKVKAEKDKPKVEVAVATPKAEKKPTATQLKLLAHREAKKVTKVKVVPTSNVSDSDEDEIDDEFIKSTLEKLSALSPDKKVKSEKEVKPVTNKKVKVERPAIEEVEEEEDDVPAAVEEEEDVPAAVEEEEEEDDVPAAVEEEEDDVPAAAEKPNALKTPKNSNAATTKTPIKNIAKTATSKKSELAALIENEIDGFDSAEFVENYSDAAFSKPSILDETLADVIGDSKLVEAAAKVGITPLFVLLTALDGISEKLDAKQTKLLTKATNFVSSYEEVEEVEDVEEVTDPNISEMMVATEIPEDIVKKNIDSALLGNVTKLDTPIAKVIDNPEIVKKAKNAGISNLYLLFALIDEDGTIVWTKEQKKLADKASAFIKSLEDEDGVTTEEPVDEIKVEKKTRKSAAKASPKTIDLDLDEEDLDSGETEVYSPRGSRGRSIDLDELDVDDDVSDWQNDDMFSNGNDLKNIVEISPLDERKYVNVVKGAMRKLLKDKEFLKKYPVSISRDDLSSQVEQRLEILAGKEEAQGFLGLSDALKESIFVLAIPVDKINLRKEDDAQNNFIESTKKIVRTYGFPIVAKQVAAREIAIRNAGDMFNVKILSIELDRTSGSAPSKAEELRIRASASEGQEFIVVFDLMTGHYSIL